MKKKSGWIAFFIDYKGRIALQGAEMFPIIYRTEKLALKNTCNDSVHKTKPPQPVKIEWMVEK